MFSWFKKKNNNESIFEITRQGDIDKLENLIRNGADINIQDEAGFTPLMIAIIRGDKDIIKFLIDSGADIKIETKNGTNAANMCLQWHKGTEILSLVFKKENLKKLDKACKLATKEDIGILLINEISAKKGGDIDTIKLLINNGADLNVKTNQERTIKIRDEVDQFKLIAIEKKNNEDEGINALMASIKIGNDEVTKLLIEKGADINCQNNYEITPLMFAIQKGNIEITKLLIEKGANISLENNNGGIYALTIALEKGNIEILKILKEKYKHNDLETFIKIISNETLQLKNTNLRKLLSDYINKNIHIEHYGNINIESEKFQGGSVNDKENKITEMYYDEYHQYMIILLNDKYYHYCGIKKEFRENFYNKKNKYKFYEKEVFGNFDARNGFVPHY